MSKFSTNSMFAILVLLTLPGCGTEPAPQATSETPGESDAHSVHEHPSTGPHDGDLVELGDERYHAEIVHGEGGKVTVYLLNNTATSQVPVDADSVIINLAHDGEAEQFTLVASPDSGDPEGKSSRFTVTSEELAHDLDHEGTVARLVVKIDGKQYTGTIEHAHDHAGEHH